LVLGFLLLATVSFGYGGFEVTSTYNNLDGLNRKLDTLLGTHAFSYRAPMWWLGGHGGEHVGPVTLGGSGALSSSSQQSDSLKSQLAAIRAYFEVGFPYVPNQWVWVRPCLDLGATGLLVYAQTVAANTKKWYAGWSIGAAPGIEVTGSLPTSSEAFIGLFVKASYLIPVSGLSWFGDAEPPSLDLRGFALQVGLRFGKNVSQAEGEDTEY